MSTSQRSPAQIRVGRDFKIGDVSGQVAVGTDITQNMYKDCTFIFPDGSTALGKSWRYTIGVRPVTDQNKIFGREQELKKIDELLKGCSALAVTGLRGTGKSTLVSMYIDELEERANYAGIYWRKIDETVDISDIVGSFFTIIGKPIQNLGAYKIGDQLSLLFQELDAAPYFLVFDNFEILIDPQTNKTIKPGFSDLIERANDITGGSRVIFTSWECPTSERGVRPAWYPIGGLDEQAAIRLLKQRGLNDTAENLGQAAKLSGGHPLALILLAQLVKEDAETLTEALADNSLWIGEEGEVAENILDKVYKERLSEEERKLLQYASLYRVPVPLEAVVAVAANSNWAGAFVKRIAVSLNKKSLFNKSLDMYWEDSLVRSYAYNKLIDRVECHKLAYQYYLSLPIPEKHARKEDIQSLIEAHYHACMAKEYGQAEDITWKVRRDLQNLMEYRALIELDTLLLPKDHFSDKPLLSSPQAHCGILIDLGHNYKILGEVKKAIEYYEKAIEIAQQTGDKRTECNCLEYIGNSYSNLNEYRKEVEYLEKALKIANEMDKEIRLRLLNKIGDVYRYNLNLGKEAVEYYEKVQQLAEEMGSTERGSLQYQDYDYYIGNIYRQLGETAKSREIFERAVKRAHEKGDKYQEMKSLLDLRLSYTDPSDREKELECLENAFKIAQETNSTFQSLIARFLGDMYIASDEAKGFTYYENAVKLARDSEGKSQESSLLVSIGFSLTMNGKKEKAIEYLEEGSKMLQASGKKWGELNLLPSLCRLYNDVGKMEKAIACCERGVKIAQEIGNKQEEQDFTLLIKKFHEQNQTGIS